MEHAGCEEDLDPIEGLLELDVLKKVYKDLAEDKQKRHNGRCGLMPLLALRYVGNNLASSYCERLNSCAKLIMPHGRALLDDEELGIVCFLRMSRTFRYYMKHQYPDVCKEWRENSKQTALLYARTRRCRNQLFTMNNATQARAWLVSRGPLGALWCDGSSPDLHHLGIQATAGSMLAGG